MVERAVVILYVKGRPQSAKNNQQLVGDVSCRPLCVPEVTACWWEAATVGPPEVHTVDWVGTVSRLLVAWVFLPPILAELEPDIQCHKEIPREGIEHSIVSCLNRHSRANPQHWQPAHCLFFRKICMLRPLPGLEKVALVQKRTRYEPATDVERDTPRPCW